jgi:uncharacterized protein YjbI with pentapeptide repeats
MYTCLHHAQDSEAVFQSLIASITDNHRHRDIVITDARFSDYDFSHIQLSTSDFARCVFHNVDFTDAKVHACFFDFCLFEN